MSQVDTANFQSDVFEIVRQIPVGNVLSYGDVARLAGYPNHARLVGRTLCRCPEQSDIPCHRVVNSAGALSCRFLAQEELLRSEGIGLKSNGCVDMSAFRWRVDEMLD